MLSYTATSRQDIQVLIVSVLENVQCVLQELQFVLRFILLTTALCHNPQDHNTNYNLL
jgi:hypothetical protein